jgi:DNA-nicking Smr family endonuclease
MTRSKPRGLRPDEEELWEQVRKRAVPLHVSKRQAIKAAIEKPKPVPIARQPLVQFEIGEKNVSNRTTHSLAPTLAQQFSAAPVQMDSKSFGKLKRGKLEPEGRIDLHGMTLDQAHPALNRFMAQSHAEGRRLVLVITGKGKTKADTGPIPARIGVLKHQVPNWLRSGGLAAMVLQVVQANARHGGEGAFYVYLRRRR